MGLFYVYILKVSFCLLLLYLPYSLLLRKEKWHMTNRCMLLAILFSSFIIPLTKSEWLGLTGHAVQLPIADELHEVFVDDVMNGAQIGEIESSLWPMLLVVSYFIGLFVMLAIRLYQWVSLYSFIPKGCLWKDYLESGVTVYCHAHCVSPFSWMNKVVISAEDYDSDAGRVILAHETAHVRLCHSYDAVLLMIAEVFLWFNPLVWLVETDLRCIHEYQADAYVLEQGVDAKTYQLYLIKKAVGSRLQSFANGLNQSTLKKRIAMMYKKSNKWAALKYMYVLPVGAIATVAFAHPEFENRVDNSLKSVSEVKVKDLSVTMKEKPQDVVPETVVIGYAPKNVPVTTSEQSNQSSVAPISEPMPRDTVFMIVEELPLYPGGTAALMQFLASNVKYPKEAINKGIHGQVVVQMIVRKDGSLSGFKVVKSAGPLLDQEALRVVSLLPNFTPGKQRGKAVSCLFNIPVTFRLQ